MSSFLDNISDEEFKLAFQKSKTFVDFANNLGYKGRNGTSINTKNKIIEKIKSLNLDINHLNRSLINKISDENFIKVFKSSFGYLDFLKKIGFSDKTGGKSSISRVKDRMKKLNLTEEDFKNKEEFTYKIEKCKGLDYLPKSFENNKIKGEYCESKILSIFLSKGIRVSRPYGDSCPYDLIIDVNDNLYKIQIKTALYEESEKCISVKVDRTVYNRKLNKYGKKNYSLKEVNWFAAYCIEKDIYVFFKNSDKIINSGRLYFRFKNDFKRVTRPVNEYNFIEDYSIEKMLEEIS